MAKSDVGDPKESSNGEAEIKVWERDTGLTIYGRIHAVMADVGRIEKDAVHEIRKDGKKVGQFPYITHDAVSAHIRPAFIKHGIMVLPSITTATNDGNRTELAVSVDFVNVDSPEDKITVRSIGYGVDKGDKGPGKAFSYAVKYAYLKLFMLNSADDIEKDDVAHDPAQARASQKQETEGRNIEALQAWANNFKEALEGAGSAAKIDELQSANKKMLMEAPETTRDYFIALIEGKKTSFEATA